MSFRTLCSYEHRSSSDGLISNTTSYQYSDGRKSRIKFVYHPSHLTIMNNPLFTIFIYPNRSSYEIMERDTDNSMRITIPQEFSYFIPLELAEANDWESHTKWNKYTRKMTTKMHSAIYEELVKRACTPKRLYQWHEDAAEQFPEEYARKCAEYK